MKYCKDCRYANWEQTSSGKLHPSGDGKCTVKIDLPVLPLSMRWMGGAPATTYPYINRRKELNDHCPRYAPKDRT